MRDELRRMQEEIDQLRLLAGLQSVRPAPSSGRHSYAMATISGIPSTGVGALAIYKIKFTDSTFTEEMGFEDPTNTQRSATEYYAAASAGLTYEIGDLVGVERRNNRLWIVWHAKSSSSSGGFCPPGSSALDVVTGVQCVSGSLVECTKTICLPDGTKVSTEDCGDGVGASIGGTVTTDCCAVAVPDTLLITIELTGTFGCQGSQWDDVLVWSGSYWDNLSTQVTFCGFTTQVYLFCLGGEFNLLFICSCYEGVIGTFLGGSAWDTQVCGPFSLIENGNMTDNTANTIENCSSGGAILKTTIAT